MGMYPILLRSQEYVFPYTVELHKMIQGRRKHMKSTKANSEFIYIESWHYMQCNSIPAGSKDISKTCMHHLKLQTFLLQKPSITGYMTCFK